MMKSSIKKIEGKLESPDCKKNVQMVIHNILQQNDIARTHLKEASRHLDDAVDRLRQAIINNIMKKEAQAPQKVFKLKQLLAIIRKQYHGKKKEFDKTLAIQHKLRLKVISINQAMEMAKNIFVRGDFKKLREEERLYNKQLQQFNLKLEQCNNRQAALASNVVTDKSLQEKYYLTKQGIELSNLQRKLDDSKLKLDNEQVRLTLLCDSYQSQNQIKLIVAVILRKNVKYVKQLEEVTKHTDELRLNLRHIKKQIETVKEHIEKLKTNICLEMGKNGICFPIWKNVKSFGNNFSVNSCKITVKESPALPLTTFLFPRLTIYFLL